MRKRTVKKVIAVATCSIMIGAMLSGCDSETQSSGDAKILFIGSSITGDSFGETLAAAMDTHAAEEGVTVELVEDTTPQAQIETISSAEADGYDAIIMQIADSSTILHTEVAAGDLPIVYVNRKPDEEHLVADQYVYVGSESYEAGTQQGEAILEKLGNPSSLNIVIMEGQAGYDALNRTKGVKQVMKDNGVDANYVFDDTANWDAEQAKEAMDTFLKTGQSFDCIFANNDTMAMGIIESLKEHGLDPADTPIAGVDGTADGCAAITSGDMVFTSFQNADGQAEYAVKAAKLLANGQSISSLEGVDEENTCVIIPYEEVDASNVSSYQ
ncbi:MAG: substrate-binding domain-containing protein [Eubacterium sp.]|nr:substrate-binding domain-containing protein [Eubacterium sp.]